MMNDTAENILWSDVFDFAEWSYLYFFFRATYALPTN